MGERSALASTKVGTAMDYSGPTICPVAGAGNGAIAPKDEWA